MNKIKAKINADDLTPWDDSVNDLIRTMEYNKQKRPFIYQNTIETPRPIPLKRRHKQKVIMSKTFLSISKINLHSPNSNPCEHIQHSQSKRYLGPRVSFYAHMNPRISTKRSKSTLDPEDLQPQESQKSRKQLTGRFIRDESIKFLQIIDEKPLTEQRKGGVKAQFPNLKNLKKMGIVQDRKSDQQHTYLRRLKMIYSTRKN